MNPLLFKQRRDLAAYEHTIRQLEGVVLGQRRFIEEVCNVACGFAWDIGAGNTPLTQDQIMAIIKERDAEEKMQEMLAKSRPAKKAVEL